MIAADVIRRTAEYVIAASEFMISGELQSCRVKGGDMMIRAKRLSVPRDYIHTIMFGKH